MKGLRRVTLAGACCLLLPCAVWSEELVRTINWQELAAASALASGTVIAAPEGINGASLRIVQTGSQPATYPLVTIMRPELNTARYAVRSRVKYDGVSAGSYLEMWSYLPDGAFFSRTLDRNGPMGRLEGSSGWRAVVMPFFNREGGAPPERLVVNLVMTGAGTVEIGPLELAQFAADEDLLADAGTWWSGRQAGVLGGSVGAALGILGALIGWLGSTGRARGFVLGTLQGIGWLGAGALACGVLALISGQPYAVYYPLLLLGIVSASLGFSLPRPLSKRYEELELRRMQALDA